MGMNHYQSRVYCCAKSLGKAEGLSDAGLKLLAGAAHAEAKVSLAGALDAMREE